MKTHYDTLGVQRDATFEEIKAAYRVKAKAFHPDREGGDPEAMSALNAAYTLLSDDVARAKYDASLPDVEREALALLERITLSATAQPGHLLNIYAAFFEAHLYEIVNTRAKAEHHRNQADLHLSRLKRRNKNKDGKPSVLSNSIKRLIAMADTHIEQKNHEEAVALRAKAYLEGYDYEMPPVPLPPDYSQH